MIIAKHPGLRRRRDKSREFGKARNMTRARGLRSLAPILTPALAILAYLGLPNAEAEAAPKNRGGGFDEGGYIMLTPGAFALPFGGNFDDDGDFFDLDPGFGWGFGGGYMFARGPAFKATVGGVFEHSVLIFDNHDFREFGGHLIRVMPEVRIGAGSNKVWGYGLFGAGPAGALFVWDWDNDVFCGGVFDLDGCRDRDGAVGFNVQFGGGVQGIVYKNLFLGGEVDFDLGYYFDDDNSWRGRDRDDFSIYQVSIEFMIGWYF
jgi:hypothetical protein